MNALLNYPGAKWGMAQEIVQIMPPHRSYIDRIRRTTMKIYISGKIAGDPDYKGEIRPSGCGEAVGGVRGEGEAEWVST